MEWTERLDLFEKHVQKRLKQGWELLDPDYKDEARFKVSSMFGGDTYIAAGIDYDGEISERKIKSPKQR